MAANGGAYGRYNSKGLCWISTNVAALAPLYAQDMANTWHHFLNDTWLPNKQMATHHLNHLKLKNAFIDCVNFAERNKLTKMLDKFEDVGIYGDKFGFLMQDMRNAGINLVDPKDIDGGNDDGEEKDEDEIEVEDEVEDEEYSG